MEKKKLKKTIYILTTFVILILVLIISLYYFVFRNNNTEIMCIQEYYDTCKGFGCYISDNNISKEADIDIIGIEQSSISKSIIFFDIWNSENNNNTRVQLEIKNSLLEDINALMDCEWPKSFTISVIARNNGVPLPYWSNIKDRIFFSESVITDINFIDSQESYLNTEGNFDYEVIAEKISSSLQIDKNLDKEQTIYPTLFLYKDSLSESSKTTSKYEEISIIESRFISDSKSVEELKYNCRILKDYYSTASCENPIHPNRDLEEVQKMASTEEDNYYLELILASEGFSDYNLTDVLENSIIDDPEYVREVRNNSWEQYYNDKNVTGNEELISYIYSLLDYMYYSDYSCNDQEDICDQLLSLYEYSKFLIYSSQGSVCSRMSYLPLLAKVTSNDLLKQDLSYILENYPFETECTTKGGNKGFCSFDLKERMACVELLSNTLKYFTEDEDIKEILRHLVKDTLAIYLEENKEITGIWGKEDINLLTGGVPDDQLYPIKYYKFIDNYLIYSILENYFDE